MSRLRPARHAALKVQVEALELRDFCASCPRWRAELAAESHTYSFQMLSGSDQVSIRWCYQVVSVYIRYIYIYVNVIQQPQDQLIRPNSTQRAPLAGENPAASEAAALAGPRCPRSRPWSPHRCGGAFGDEREFWRGSFHRFHVQDMYSIQ